jgi:carbohydrate-selective porin OprB
MNWALFNNTAWDYAADTRGYTNGIAVAWITPRGALRLGSFQMPTRANGNDFDSDVLRARGDNIELTWSALGEHAPVLRLLGYMNHGRMGSYADALATAERTHRQPSIAADDRPGRVKYGAGLNAELPIADSGATGAFIRLGWNDDRTESFVFTEVKTHVSGGVQVSGARWHRAADRLGLAVVSHGIGPLHRLYLQEGGDGFMLGDGALTYGHEMIVEGYYLVQLGHYLELTPDVQHVSRPGYNRARGPVVVFAVRGNVRW